jgi:Photosynthetic reaction centre cytochrome C subunit
MKTLAIALFVPFALFAQQQKGAPPTPKNLKVLAANTPIGVVMRGFNQALGVQCTFCHVQGDFASDENPKKDIARKMIAMVRQTDAAFPSSEGVFPAGYHEVDCMTCHRGSSKPATKAPKEFINLGEANGFQPPPPTPGVNLKVLPADTLVHGHGSIMHDFRDALSVDCGFCHGGGKGFEADENPRKATARRMITMTRDLNVNFPGAGPYPTGKLEVTCYTCHAGSPHPQSASNVNHAPDEKK